MVASPVSSAPADTIAPTSVMPLMAFDPDIKGVCSVGGTLVIISNPTKMARTKMVRLAINAFVVAFPAVSPLVVESSESGDPATLPVVFDTGSSAGKSDAKPIQNRQAAAQAAHVMIETIRI